MFTPQSLCACCFLILCLLSPALAQVEQPDNMERPAGQLTSSSTVTASASAERVRYTSANTVVQMHLQVYDQSGQLVFDVSSKGNVLDWTLQDSGGARLNPGAYLSVVTVKSLSGRLSQRIGTVSVQDKTIELQRVDTMQMSVGQQQAVGPIEENGALTIVQLGETEAATVVAHNGSEGQVNRSRGALSFRLGDFFSGKDAEQMRLTEEGNLGIGTDKPQAKLDVAGVIRTSKGIEFANGTDGTNVTKLTATANGSVQQTLSDGTVVTNATGTGTQNKIAKWTDNAGTLGDSVVTESTSGFLGVGTPTPVSLLELAGSGVNGSGGITLGTGAVAKSVYQVISVGNEILSFFGGNIFLDNALASQRFNPSQVGWAVTLDGRASQDLFKLERLNLAGATTRPAVIRGDGSFGFGNMTSPPNLTGAKFMMDSAGNVGIGTNNPDSRLSVHASGVSNALTVITTGSARAGFFRVDSAGSSHPAVRGESNGTGSTMSSVATGNGNAGFFEIFNAASNSSALDVTTNGLGPALTVRTETPGATVASFGGNGDFAFTIEDAGKVGIGVAFPQARLDIRGGASFDGTNDPRAIAFSWSGGGYRHWIRTRHNGSGIEGNAIDFFTNNATSAIASSAPGTGNQLVMSLDGGNAGIGTQNPKHKLHVNGGDVFLETIGAGLILRSNNGTCYLLTVTNTGTLVTDSIACP